MSSRRRFLLPLAFVVLSSSGGAALSAHAGGKPPRAGSVWRLHQHVEPREGAFTVLLPQGWIFEGNPTSGRTAGRAATATWSFPTTPTTIPTTIPMPPTPTTSAAG
jgi:hypothetical protein